MERALSSLKAPKSLAIKSGETVSSASMKLRYSPVAFSRPALRAADWPRFF